MKILLIITLILTSSSSFAVSYCKIKGTSQVVGYFPGDNVRGPSIYIQGKGYYRITSVEDQGEVFISVRNERTVILDFRNRALTINGVTQQLVNCSRNGSE